MSTHDATLARVQAITGLGFALFLLVHLTTVCAALLGPGVANQALALARHAYQSAVVEALVLGCLAAHVLAGLLRARARRQPADNPTTRVHRRSGQVLALVLIGHILATRGPSWWLDTPVDFGLVSFTLERYGWLFYPYYVALFAFGAFHMVRGSQLALARVRAPIPSPWLRMPALAWRPWLVALALLALTALLALGGVFYAPDRTTYPTLESLLD